MLEQLRRNSRSFIIWILFGIIIAVFIVSFGPQAQTDSLGCGYSDSGALEVADEEVPLSSWRFAVNSLRGGGPQQAMMRRQHAVDLLVERELLAQAAEERGFQVSDEVVNQAIAAGEFYIMGHLSRMQDAQFWRDFQHLERLAMDLGLANVAQLAEEQRREHLAEMMRHLLLRSATVSDEEARQFYVQQNTKVTAEYVKFDIRRYRSALKLGEADLKRYVDAHDADLKKAWEAEKTQWSSDKPRVLARHIMINKDPAKPADKAGADKAGADKAGADKAGADKAGADKAGADKAGADKAGADKQVAGADKKPGADKPAAGADKKPGDKPGDKPAEDKAPAADRAKAALAKLTGGADFAAVATEFSEDQTKTRGGLLGWRPSDSLGYGKELVEAAKKLAVGKVSEVIETDRAYHILRIEERSEKGLTYEQKRMDLAVKLAPDYYARALARRDAEQALAMAQNKPLEELFERKKAPAGNNLPSDLSPELLEQIRQLQGQGIDIQTAPPGEVPPGEGEGFEGEPAPGPGEGASPGEGAEPEPTGEEQGGLILREGPTRLAQAGQPAEPPAKPAPADPAAPAKPAPAGGPAAKPAPGAPAKPTSPGSKPPAPGQPSGAGAEELPAVTVEKPGLQTVGPVARMGDSLAGLGQSDKMVADLFEKLEVGKLAPEVYEVRDLRGIGGGDGFAIVVLKGRDAADLAKFEPARAKIIEDMTYGARVVADGDMVYGKSVLHLSEWIKQRCADAARNGTIKVNPELFAEGQEEGEQQPGYQPCATLNEDSVAGQLTSRREDPQQ